MVLFVSACGRAGANDMFESYLWEKRVVLVFSPSSSHPDFVKQKVDFEAQSEALADRDIVVWHFVDLESVLVDGSLQPHLSTNPFYERFGVGRDRFAVILLGKDGDEKLRHDAYLPLAELFETIDAMPMRQNEMLKN